MAFSPTPSAALRYWNSARQRYCRQSVRYRKTLRLCRPDCQASSPDPRGKPGSRPFKAAAGERQTVCWREMDSNYWYRGTKSPLPKFPVSKEYTGNFISIGAQLLTPRLKIVRYGSALRANSLRIRTRNFSSPCRELNQAISRKVPPNPDATLTRSSPRHAHDDPGRTGDVGPRDC